MSGLSSFDLLGNIPSSHRTLMRLFLRRIRLTAEGLEKAIAELPPEKQLTSEQLGEAIAALLEQGWIEKSEQDGQVTYSVKQISTGH